MPDHQVASRLKHYPRPSVGDVIQIYYPNEENPNLTTFRPGIVIECDSLEALIVPMTKQLHQQKNYPESFIIEKDSADGKMMKLGYDSLIIPSRKAYFTYNRIMPYIGMGKCPAYILDKLLGEVD